MGLDPTATELKAQRSTLELRTQSCLYMTGNISVRGIEPRTAVRGPAVLPLHHTEYRLLRLSLVKSMPGVEPGTLG